jgi:UDP-N-acetylmuramoyl-L-alanyl-D-glutamate--2,6-diaminopimelate ligase
MEVGEGMKESIPPILRPEHVVPVGLQNFAAHFGLAASGETDSETLSAVALTGISMNTNDLRAGDLFVAMPGLKTHGANFISKAVANGAVAVVTDAAGLQIIDELKSTDETVREANLPVLLLENPRAHLGDLAAFVYGNVAGNLPKIFGTTGTNGKTSTSYLLEGLLRQIGEVTGLTSTAERHIAGEVIVSRLTTPESPEMQALIARMRERGVSSVAIEVSAQALSQLRVDGIRFDVVGFTNLSHDHFDDYPNFETYLKAKVALFTPERAAVGVVSLDSRFGADFVAASKIPVVTISSDPSVSADWNVTITEQEATHTGFELRGPNGELVVSSVPLIGAHMAANGALAVVMAVLAGFDWRVIAERIKGGINAFLPGRTEMVNTPDSATGAVSGPAVYVDFGHSPDAFLHTLQSLRTVTKGRLFMVFGADGDRDASKRPDMARISAENSDVLVITDHHPRFENPVTIRETLVNAARAAKPELELYEVSPPEQAIRKAVSLAGPGDSILWAGPGHQDYRDIQGKRTPYSARQEARDALKEQGWS